MKTVKKEVNLELSKIKRVDLGQDFNCNPVGKFTYTFECYEAIKNVESLKSYVDVEVPETLKEFRQLHDITKNELLEWLIERYNK